MKELNTMGRESCTHNKPKEIVSEWMQENTIRIALHGSETEEADEAFRRLTAAGFCCITFLDDGSFPPQITYRRVTYTGIN